jgi:hypothetical protein
VVGGRCPERQQSEGVVVGARLALVAGDEGMQGAETPKVALALFCSSLSSHTPRGNVSKGLIGLRGYATECDRHQVYHKC